jgi:haloalkane dehalogenase
MKRDFLRNETFEGTFPFKPNYKEINGFQMHYIDEGRGESIVCLHGQPTWSYLYRNFVKGLAKNYRMIVPDYMGFGKSDVPEHLPYRLAQHIDNLKKLLLGFNLKNITLVMQDWGGPIGFGFAVDYPERVKRLVIMNTSIGNLKEGAKPWYAPFEEKGTYDQFIKDTSNIIKLGMYNKKKITPILLKAYAAPFPRDEYYRGALSFPKDIPIGNSHPSSEIMLRIRNNLHILVDKSKLLIWGMKDPIFPVWLIDWWNKTYPGIETHKIENASHFLQEDEPDEIVAIIKNFLVKNS